MNRKKTEGNFYAAKVRLFLNEYGGENLEEFCQAERVSYNKMLNCLGRSSYTKPATRPVTVLGPDPVDMGGNDESEELLPELPLLPLVVDQPNEAMNTGKKATKEYRRTFTHRTKYELEDVTIHLRTNLSVGIGKCDVATLACLIKEMEVAL